jgi:ribulose-5-phosphate 4-epimerase/fuculose-1-phosphate aldolase
MKNETNASLKANLPTNIDPAEWQVRCDLAALYRLVAHFRMTDFIYTHISARVPGPDHHFLINDYGVMFHEMTGSDLVKVDLDGNIVDVTKSSQRINQAGYTIHSAIHAAREDLTCVIHTHTAAGIAVSTQEIGLLPISQHALKFYGHISYHDYEGFALDLDERARLVAHLGPKNKSMILRNHGLLVCGRSIPEAFVEVYSLERACQAQIAALAGGSKLVIPPVEVCERTASQYNSDPALRQTHAGMAWRSALRLIDDGFSE